MEKRDVRDGERGALAVGVPWWGRLESRMTFALVAVAILCVGASGYLVQLAAQYFEEIGDAQDRMQEQLVEIAQPFYEEMAAAKLESFEARATVLGLSFEAQAPVDARRWFEGQLRGQLDVLAVRLETPRASLMIDRVADSTVSASPPQRSLGGPVRGPWHRVRRDIELSHGGTLEIVYGVNPSLAFDYQRLGSLKRELGKVNIGGAGSAVARDEVVRALVLSLSVASGLVLFVSIFAGLVIGRQTTRKLSDLSAVMRRVALGDFAARAPRLGNDELGQLASAFNGMLDELDQARETVGYLQRIGAWQDMARRIAHEIKNPLTPIQLAVQQIREKDPRQSETFTQLLRDSVEIVEDEIETLRRMVTSFSQFARLPVVKLEPVAIGRILDEFHRAYGHLSDRSQDRLEVVFAGDAREKTEVAGLQILADRQLLKQVLVNLVENALLSARDASIDATHVRVLARWAGDGRLELRVEDNGPGVPEGLRDRLFEPYVTTRAHGSGLGLAIVKKVVLDHGGEIALEETSLGGAAFVIRLPILRR